MAPLLSACALAQLLAAVALQWEAAPKPYGHTSKVHPFKANHDREWYTEGRQWNNGTEYKPQDGDVSVPPVHEKPPPTQPPPTLGRAKGGMLNKPVNRTAQKAAKAAKGRNVTMAKLASEAKMETAGRSAVQARMAKVAAAADNPPRVNRTRHSHRVPKKQVIRKNRRELPPQEIHYAQPKLEGHTSKVHPSKGKHDQKWWVEARWNRSEYEAQDGPITDQPQHVRTRAKAAE